MANHSGTRSNVHARAACMMLVVVGAGLSAGPVLSAPPPTAMNSVVRSDQTITNPVDFNSPFGTIGSAMAFGAGNGQGVSKVAISNSGQWIVQAKIVQTDPNLDNALLRQPTGLSAYIAEGTEGYLTQPSSTHVASGFNSISINNSDSLGMSFGLFPDGFGFTMPSSGVYLNNNLVALEGGAVAAAGLALGTTWARFDGSTTIRVNDAGKVMICSNVIESGTPKRAIVVFTTNGSGMVTSTSLIAKETGLVGGGPATWSFIAPGAHAIAFNNAGKVIFSGITSSGVNGIYFDGAFIAQQGGPTPVVGANWGELYNAPVDLNNSGQYFFRGKTADGSGMYTEPVSQEAGELMDTAARTFGNGDLTLVSGSLIDDADVDMFRIVVTDAMAFSATTVPNPGMGFPGAAFDTVLTIIASPENGTRPRTRCNDVSPGVIQSTVTGGQLTSGREYYLCISTPKARTLSRYSQWATGTSPTADSWAQDAEDLAFNAGLVYWPDPSESGISRATTAGVLQSDLAAPAISQYIAIHAAQGKVFWADRNAGSGVKIRRANLDGSNIEDIVNDAAFGLIGSFATTGLAIDQTNNHLYWTREVYGEINRCDLDGSNQTRIIQDYPPTEIPGSTGTFAPQQIVVDAAGGKLYYYNKFNDRIERCNLNGTSRQTLAVGAGAFDLALHGGKIYFSVPSAGKIRQCNLDGSALVDFLSTPAPSALVIDSAGGVIYWSNTLDRIIRKANLVGPSASDLVSLVADVGERSPDGQGAGSTFDSWARSAAATPGALPYQIKLTGSTFRHEEAMLVKGNQKFAAVGDTVPGISPYLLIGVGDPESALRISDRGDVMWYGTYYKPTLFNNFLFGGLFWNGELLLESQQLPSDPGLLGNKVAFLFRQSHSLDMSDDGEHAIAIVNMQPPPFIFNQKDHAVTFDFTLPPLCGADFNNSGDVEVADIFAFLNAWFAQFGTCSGVGVCSADINDNGTVEVADIFAFLNIWFSEFGNC